MNAFRRVVGGVVCVGFLGGVVWAGDLNPPPGPVMPTDDVVLNAQAITLPYVITQPGAYRLTSNLVGNGGLPDGIQIQASDVWLDLGGFVLDGQTAGGIITPGDGILVTGGFDNVTVLNGVIRNWGDDGIDLALGGSNRVMRINALNNGGEGIDCNRSEVLDCQVLNNAFGGITAIDHSIVERCRAFNNNGPGILVDNGSKVADCVTDLNADGIIALFHCVVVDCTASDNQNFGFLGDEHTKFADCVAARNQFEGFHSFIGGIFVDCISVENGQLGFFTDIGGTVTNCKAARNVDGFAGIAGVKFSECTATENTNFGFFGDIGTTIRDCNANMNLTAGINVLNMCEVENCHAWFNGGGEFGGGTAGIECIGSGNRVSNNDCKDNPANYLDTFGGNTFFGNSSHQPSGAVGPGPPHYALPPVPVSDVGPITKAQFGPTAYANIWYP